MESEDLTKPRMLMRKEEERWTGKWLSRRCLADKDTVLPTAIVFVLFENNELDRNKM
jgi:hypothetical protein